MVRLEMDRQYQWCLSVVLEIWKPTPIWQNFVFPLVIQFLLQLRSQLLIIIHFFQLLLCCCSLCWSFFSFLFSYYFGCSNVWIVSLRWRSIGIHSTWFSKLQHQTWKYHFGRTPQNFLLSDLSNQTWKTLQMWAYSKVSSQSEWIGCFWCSRKMFPLDWMCLDWSAEVTKRAYQNRMYKSKSWMHKMLASNAKKSIDQPLK